MSGPTSQSNRSRDVRAHLVAAILLCGYLICGLSLWVEADWRASWDGALYILTGQSLAAGEGYTYLGRPFFLRPPGLSWLIARTQGAEFQPLLLNRLILVCAAAALAAIYFAVHRLHGAWIALAVASLVATTPFFVGSFNLVHSEFPFMALLYLGVGLFAGPGEHAPRGHARAWGLGAAFCLAAAFYVRSVVLVVVPGMFLLAWLGRRAVAGVAAALVVLSTLPWFYYARWAEARAELPSEQLALASYATALFRVDPGDPASELVSLTGWLARIAHNGSALLSNLGEVTLATHALGVGWLVLGLCVLGWNRALHRGPSLLEWLAVAYGALILTYFTYGPRLLMPVLPLVYLYSLLALRTGVTWLTQRSGRPVAAGRVGIGVFALLLVLNLMRMPGTLDPWRDREDLSVPEKYEAATREVAEWIRESTPEDAVLMSNQAPIYSVLSGRRFYTYRFLRSPDVLARYRPDYVVFDLRTETSDALIADVVRHAEERWELVSEQSDWTTTVYRMAWER